MEIPQLQKLIGHEILAVIPMLHPTQLQLIRLHGVETGGIWIECETFTQKVLRDMNLPASGKTPALFVPYAGIRYLLDAVDKTALSESAFGG